jgi:hypothetical protein
MSDRSLILTLPDAVYLIPQGTGSGHDKHVPNSLQDDPEHNKTWSNSDK